MCGITGIFSFDNSVQSYEPYIHKSLQLLNKRGPDASGSHFFNKFAAAHARLSIIDTSSLANQPFFDPTGQFMLVFNGEIFNFQELKSFLSQKYQVQFKTNSDTEVLLYLLIHEGTNSLNKLNGFWAFAFYNNHSKTCIIARDRLGKKPLWYTHQNSFFCFASEFKALNAYPINKVLDTKSISLFFRLSYLPSPYTPFSNIHKLEPGCYLNISEEGTISKHRYFNLPYYEKSSAIDYVNAQKHVKELIHKSVAQRLISDVPMGAFLSGGLDSAIVSAVAKQHQSDLNTFCLSFPDLPYLNESDFAQETANFIGTKHHTLPVSQKEMLLAANEVLNYSDELYADSSAIALQALCKTVRPHCTVALSGDGGDEVFGGYRKYQAMSLAMQYESFNFIAFVAARILHLIPSSRHTKFGDQIRKLQKFANLVSLHPNNYYNFTLEWFHGDFVKDLLNLSNDELAVTSRIDEFKKTKFASVNNWLYNDLNLLLQGDMLTKVDLFSMNNSMEIRNPLLDHEIIEFAAKLPAEYKVGPGFRKKILFDAFKDELPSNMAVRPKKGFEVPLQHWMKNEWMELLNNEWLNPIVIKEQGILNPSKIESLKQDVQKGNNSDAHFALWNAVVFTKWFSLYN